VIKSSHSLLSALLGTAVVVTAVLLWFGWKTRADHTVVEQQRERERLETGADAIAAGIREKLAEAAERLSDWLARPASSPPAVEGAVVFGAAGGRIAITPPGALPFVPVRDVLRAPHPSFVEAEALEFRYGDATAALARYRQLVNHADPHVRAGALLRSGRVLLKAGRLLEAGDAYARLAALEDVDVDGYPAALAGFDGQRVTAAAAKDRASEQRFATEIVTSIDKGRWRLSRGMAEQYRDLPGAPPRPESWSLAEALTNALGDWDGRPSERGLRVFATQASPVIVLWRSNAAATALAVGFAARMLPAVAAPGIAYQLTDAEGIVAIGDASSSARQPVVRVIGDRQDPWTLKVWHSSPIADQGPSDSVVPVMIVAVIGFLWAAVYFIARAITREAAVARLQSDFVAAVSHEFRSPLTTMRQLAEMLEMGQVPSEDRRRKYYEVLASEAQRLQRLVETLLNFGQMEANAQQYRFVTLDVPPLVRRVAEDIGRSAQHSGRRIEASGPDTVPPVIGDAEALGVAVRNLIDNALKYSPTTEPVRVEWAAQNGHVSIRVTDNGLGIAPSERAAIFQKFVRGRAAAAANVKGTGVGLAMVQHIITAHRGDVVVDSEPGRGATFTLQLPAVS
jgi:signal transduction histidine kinase